MIREKQLGESQRMTVPHFGSILIIAELVFAHRPEIRQVLPDRVFQLLGVFGGHVAANVENVHRAATVAAEFQPDAGRGRVCAIHEIGQVGVRDGRAQDEAGVEGRSCLLRRGASGRVEEEARSVSCVAGKRLPRSA